MKKFMFIVITEAINYGLMASLIVAALTDNDSILNITATAFWIIIFLGCFFGAANVVVSYGIKYSTNEKELADGLVALERFSKQRNVFRRAWGWLCLAVVTGLLAYGGWVFTAVCYVLASSFVRLCASLVRENIRKYKERTVQALA